MKTRKRNIGLYEVKHEGKVWSISQEEAYWRAEDGETAIGAKRKKDLIAAIQGDFSKVMFNEWI